MCSLILDCVGWEDTFKSLPERCNNNKKDKKKLIHSHKTMIYEEVSRATFCFLCMQIGRENLFLSKLCSLKLFLVMNVIGDCETWRSCCQSILRLTIIAGRQMLVAYLSHSPLCLLFSLRYISDNVYQLYTGNTWRIFVWPCWRTGITPGMIILQQMILKPNMGQYIYFLLFCY